MWRLFIPILVCQGFDRLLVLAWCFTVACLTATLRLSHHAAHPKLPTRGFSFFFNPGTDKSGTPSFNYLELVSFDKLGRPQPLPQELGHLSLYPDGKGF